MTLVAVFAKNLQQVRSVRAVSQQTLASKTGLSISYISMLECGRRSPSLETVVAIARVLRVPPPSLLQPPRGDHA